ncbi:MAG TPA: aldehyde dehydrogenase family protein [Ilumatobacteraceae bacterium]
MDFDGLNIAKLLIDGDLVDAEHGATYDNINPATEEVMGVAADASSADVELAIRAARRAFETTSWSTDVALRVRCLRQLQEALTKHADPFVAMTTAEVGLPAKIAPTAGLSAPVAAMGWVADLLERYEFSTDYGIGGEGALRSRRWVEREAVGVVGCIVPWNQPTQVTLAKVSPALAAGNAVVLKAPPTTPWVAAALGKIVAEHTDIPAGIFNVITSSANTRGEELVTSRDVDLISFTGSSGVGRHIMKLAADTVKKCFLELGGKSAAILLDDADFVSALQFPAFLVCVHGGQGCATLSRLLLPRSRFDEGVQIAAAMMSAMPYGDPTDPNNVMGPLNSAQHRDRVEGYVERAKAAGANVVIGGRRPPQFDRGYYYEPTLMTGLPEDAEIVRNEVFGPVLVALPYDDDDDAVRIANDSVYGLSGAVYSGDHQRSLGVARKIRVGTMIVDGGLWHGPDVPFGGYKQSGIGRENGVMGFEEYLEVKALAEPV